jgi:hypothetical protein
MHWPSFENSAIVQAMVQHCSSSGQSCNRYAPAMVPMKAPWTSTLCTHVDSNRLIKTTQEQRRENEARKTKERKKQKGH